MEVDKIKESIKKAAQDLFRKYGYHKTSVNEIAKRAKIAKATIYKYFESKELLLQAILMEYIQQSVHEIIHNSSEELDEEAYLSMIILKTSRLSYTVCNEFIGWEFIRESANSQEFLKTFSFICLLSFDVYVKKQLIESLIDDLHPDTKEKKKK